MEKKVTNNKGGNEEWMDMWKEKNCDYVLWKRKEVRKREEMRQGKSVVVGKK